MNRRPLGALGAAATVLGVVLVSVLAACETAVPGARGPGCLPSPLHVSPDRVRAGHGVTVSSGPFACDASYRPGKTYALVLAQAGRAVPLDLGVVPVDADGAFQVDVRIPASASPGRSYVIVEGSPYDHCRDGDASCAGYAVGLRVTTR